MKKARPKTRERTNFRTKKTPQLGPHNENGRKMGKIALKWVKNGAFGQKSIFRPSFPSGPKWVCTSPTASPHKSSELRFCRPEGPDQGNPRKCSRECFQECAQKSGCSQECSRECSPGCASCCSPQRGPLKRTLGSTPEAPRFLSTLLRAVSRLESTFEGFPDILGLRLADRSSTPERTRDQNLQWKSKT